MSGGALTSRNAPCPCGSGKRYKHCCGQQQAAIPLRYEALAAQRAGLLGRAETLYRQALAQNPADADALHMLGVVHLQRMRYRSALQLLCQAGEQTQWAVSDIRHNVGVVLSRLNTREANIRQAHLLSEFLALESARRQSRREMCPTVSVVLRTSNDAGAALEAIDFIAEQTYRDIELIVVDDGSTDGSVAPIRTRLASFPFPARIVERSRRGAAATINEGATLATGAYLAFLDAGARYAPTRIATLVDDIARAGCAWGFSLVADASAPDGDIDLLLQKQRNVLGALPNSFAFVEYNLALSSANLFVERAFFLKLGGFGAQAHAYVRDFCLRASALSEPGVVHRPLLSLRAPAPDTPDALEEEDRVVAEFLAKVLGEGVEPANPLAPHAPRNHAVLLKVAFRAGLGRLVSGDILRAMAGARLAEPQVEPHATPAPSSRDKTALVVLGMHRSGTSAMSRVLNLCGAFIPEKVKPPKRGVNDKGFWEPEAVLELNVRLMRQLGGEWDHVNFTLPDSGEIVDEFLGDAATLLASEYEGRDTIVIKDPRMCVLAPLWHRALTAAGYRPLYVVPIRNPLEVAQSLHARGDMTVREGLTLWSTYMERVADFSAQRADAFYVRYTDLLDDWRDVVARIGRRFGVALDAGDRAAEVDRFLEHSLRNQSATEAELAARCAEWSSPAIEIQYRSSLRRCDADREAGTTRISSPGEAAHEASAGFVLCIENNSIRDQALLLCESIRRFAGRYREAQILAFAPRPGLGLDREAQRRLIDMNVTYVDEPLNTTCLDYAPANRVFAGAYAETHAECDFLVVLDSDTVWLNEPELPLAADAAARPVDFKSSATRGPGDRFEPYWQRMAELCGTSLDRLPMVHSTIGNELIRVSYNAGLTVVRRDKGILRRCAELFRASLVEGIRPYAGSGHNVFASTGHVGQAGSEFWGSSQTALTLAIWSLTDRVVHYPDCYNVPLHLLAADSEIDPRWLVRPPVHLHYHWMFAPRHHEVAMELLTRLGLPRDRWDWLLARTPLASGDDESSSQMSASEPSVSFPADRESRERKDPSTIRAVS